MVRMRKVYFFKVIAVCLSACILLDTTGYAIDSTQKYSLRVPLMTKNPDGLNRIRNGCDIAKVFDIDDFLVLLDKSGVSKQMLANHIYGARSWEQLEQSFISKGWIEVDNGFFYIKGNRKKFTKFILALWNTVYSYADRKIVFEYDKENGTRIRLKDEDGYDVVLHGVIHGVVRGEGYKVAERLNRNIAKNSNILVVECKSIKKNRSQSAILT